MSDDSRTLLSIREDSAPELNFRELRIATRVGQGLPDDLPQEVADQVVQLTRSASVQSEGPKYGMDFVSDSTDGDWDPQASMASGGPRG